jgi:hypothetical protein
MLRVFIPDPVYGFFPSRIPDPGFIKAQDPGSGSAALIICNRKQLYQDAILKVLRKLSFSLLL